MPLSPHLQNTSEATNPRTRRPPPPHLHRHTRAQGLALTALLAYLVSFGAGLSGVAWVVVAEIYPMRVRAAAVAQATCAHWLCDFVVSETYLYLVSHRPAARTHWTSG